MIRILTALALLGCGARPAEPAGGWTYELAVAADGHTAQVTACTPGGVPALPEREAEVVTDYRVEGACARFTLQLVAASVASGRADVALYALPDVIIQPRLWLARPPALPDGITATVHLKLPEGMQAFVPWRPLGGDRYEIDWTAFLLDGRMVLTRQTPRVLTFGETRIQTLTVGRALDAPQAAVDAWILDAVRGIAAVFGAFPADRLQILLIGSPGDEVGFGMVARGGGPAALIYVGHGASAETLAGDWTMAHELFHLGMPRLMRGDEWFSEGITSYYTYVVRARAGVIDAATAWSKLHDGFERGRGARTGRPLGEESRAMHQNYAYWPVYWGGAAFAALADARLRAQGHNLDEVVRGWLALGDPALWYSAETLLARADESFPEARLGVLAAELLGAPPIPEGPVAALYRDYGLRALDPSRVALGEGPHQATRDAVMAPAAP